MSWYRYGSQKTTIVCGPSDSVQKSLNTAQLLNGELKYHFDLTGEQKGDWTVKRAYVRSGDSGEEEIPISGNMPITHPEGGSREYTFRILCTNASGEELTFTFVLLCARSADLELELSWQKRDGSTAKLLCAPHDSAAKTLHSRDLTEHIFLYTPALTGGAKDKATITEGRYTASSGDSGELSPMGGTLVLKPGESYDLTFGVQYEDMTLYFSFRIDYTEAADVKLNFTWLERGSIPRALQCLPGGKTETEVRGNQLSAGAVKYEMALTGEDAANARILNISYTSATGGGKLLQNGTLAMSLHSGASENVYTILVTVLAGGQQLRYEIVLRYAMDVTLEMTYTLKNGETRSILCENGRTRTAEAIYDDELTDGLLHYRMKLTGSAGEGMTITQVQCYQSGSGRTQKLQADDSVALLLKNGRTGENTFTITAQSGDTTCNLPSPSPTSTGLRRPSTSRRTCGTVRPSSTSHRSTSPSVPGPRTQAARLISPPTAPTPSSSSPSTVRSSGMSAPPAMRPSTSSTRKIPPPATPTSTSSTSTPRTPSATTARRPSGSRASGTSPARRPAPPPSMWI